MFRCKGGLIPVSRSGCQTPQSDEQRQSLNSFSKSHIKSPAKSETELQGFWLHKAIPPLPKCWLLCTLGFFFKKSAWNCLPNLSWWPPFSRDPLQRFERTLTPWEGADIPVNVLYPTNHWNLYDACSVTLTASQSLPCLHCWTSSSSAYDMILGTEFPKKALKCLIPVQELGGWGVYTFEIPSWLQQNSCCIQTARFYIYFPAV